MTSINIRTFVQNNTKNVWIYTSLVEWIVNWIHWIEELNKWNKWWKIVIEFVREKQESVDKLSEISSIKIIDNGIWFNSKNYESFDKIHTEHKIEKWWKGFWRLTFLKFFENIKVSSYFYENNDYKKREFDFVNEDDIIKNPFLIEHLPKRENKTTVNFNIQKKNIWTLDKQLKTIARKLFEKLLVYFVDDNYLCPQIILKDNEKEIVLNEFLDKYKEIQLLKSEQFSLKKIISKKNYNEDFVIKIFKVYFTNSSSTVNLVADKRVVIDEKLEKFIPEFSEWFSDEFKNDKGIVINKDYVIKVYVLWRYLNDNVLHDREWFDFENSKTEIWAFKKEEIYDKSINILKTIFEKEYNTRKDKKIKRIKNYINSKAFWHKPYVDFFDYTDFWYKLWEEEMETELQKLKFKLEQKSRNEINSLIQDKDLFVDSEKRANLIKNISDTAKSDLIHYVVNRKLVLDYFKELLKRDENWKVSLEKELHNVIYPMWKDSTNTDYEEHNLWLLDERLVFSEYIASDKKISNKKSKLKNKSNKEPDLLMFNNLEPYRLWDNKKGNPITIFEFKRPKRETYSEWDNPIIQIAKYLEDIKAGKYEMPDWYEKINASDETPAYWYLIADITPKIKDFAKQQWLTLSPDGRWYFGYLVWYKLYIEIISYSKLVEDAELRNKIFFNKLWINKL